MAETAGAIVRDALLELTTQAEAQSIPAIDLNAGIRYLNRMMAALDAEGIKLGYTLVDSPNDALTVPAGAIEAMVFNLALRLANSYDVPVSPALQLNASESMKTLGIIGVRPGKSNFPGNLPIGSGNESAAGGYSNQIFYPDCCEDDNSCNNTTSNGDTNGL